MLTPLLMITFHYWKVLRKKHKGREIVRVEEGSRGTVRGENGKVWSEFILQEKLRNGLRGTVFLQGRRLKCFTKHVLECRFLW